MSDGLYRVSVARVLPGCDDLDPPYQPHGVEEHMVLRDCRAWTMLWPKTQLHVGGKDTTPQTTPPVLPEPSHGKTAAPLPPLAPCDVVADLDMHKAQGDNDEDAYDDYITNEFDGLFMPSIDEPFHATDARNPAVPADKPNTCTKHLFGSQETPPAGAEDPEAKRGTIFSPNTLHKAACEELVAGDALKGEGKKKAQKRTKKGASQPAPKPIRAQDGPPKHKDVMYGLHVVGIPMLSQRMLDAASEPMRSLHDGVLTIERRLLREKDLSYPVFVVKVPEGRGFVDKAPADLFFLRFDDIFNMFHLKWLHYTLVRLFSLSMAMQVLRENTPGIAIVDPYYMRDSVLANPGDRQVVKEYLQAFMLANKRKDYILMPFFPE